MLYITCPRMDELEMLRRKRLEELQRRFAKASMMTEMPDRPVELNDANMDDLINRYDTVVVDCWAEWCAPCRIIAPIVEQFAKEFNGKILFGKLNVDKNQITAMKYQIMSIPTLLVFKNGKLVDRIIGAMPRDMLRAKILRYQ